jgi:hypothetical protein
MILIVGLHDSRLITVAEKSSPETMAAIHTPGEGVLEPFHIKRGQFLIMKKGSVLDNVYSLPNFLRRYKRWFR